MTLLQDDTINLLLSSLGYSTLYPPQELAISRGVLEGKNLLVTTPTASGKTLIAMMAMAKTIERGQKAVYLTPLRALAAERYNDLQVIRKLDGRKLQIMVATGDYDSSGQGLAAADIIVLTNEKMDALIRHDASWLAEVGLFVADEVHIIGERERGPTLEMILTRIMTLYPDSQILALSATVANAHEVAQWLGCDVIESNWRPTRLVEGVYAGGQVRLNDGRIFEIQQSGTPAIDVALDSVRTGGQALIFAETRKRASSLAAKATPSAYTLLDRKSREAARAAAAAISSKGSDTELTKTLAQMVSKGVAFHHAGLDAACREAVEKAFRDGLIRLLVATPTLAAGVNLPARRVVVASILRYDFDYGSSVPITVLEYKQLCGRAGRPKYDTEGEAIIVAGEYGSAGAGEIYDHYILGSPEPLESQLASDRATRFHLLSVIATVPGIKRKEIDDLFGRTLLAMQQGIQAVTSKINTALVFLEREDLVRSRNERYVATEFGRKASQLYLDPLTAVGFRKAIESIEIEIEKQNWSAAENSERTGGRLKKTMHTLGFLHLITDSQDFYPKMSLRKKDMELASALYQSHHNELFAEVSEYDFSRSLLALYDWVEEKSERHLYEKLGVEPGDMHRMVEVGEWLTFCLYEVARLLKRTGLLSELYTLRTRVKYGISEELVPLVSLEGIGRARARALYDAGLTDVAKLADAPQSKLASVPKIGPAVAAKLKEQLDMKKRGR